MSKKDNWIQESGIGRPGHKGKLHKKLDIPMGEKIPEKVLEKATKSKSPSLKKEAVEAETLRGLKKK